jgi:hypothetical protein
MMMMIRLRPGRESDAIEIDESSITEETNDDFYSLGLRTYRNVTKTTRLEHASNHAGHDHHHNYDVRDVIEQRNPTATILTDSNSTNNKLSMLASEGQTDQKHDGDNNGKRQHQRQHTAAVGSLRKDSMDPIDGDTFPSTSKMNDSPMDNRANSIDASSSSSSNDDEKDSSFFKSWKYQPVLTNSKLATPTTTATTTSTTSSQHQNGSNNKDLGSEENRNATTTFTSTTTITNDNNNDSNDTTTTSSNTTKQSGSSTSPAATPDYASFFQNWRYQPVTTTSSSAANSNKNHMNKTSSQQQDPPSSSLTSSALVNPNQTILITLADLQEYLRAQGYVRKSDLPPSSTTSSSSTTKSTAIVPKTKGAITKSTSTTTTSSSTSTSSSRGVAFPQKILMKTNDLRIACIICGSSLAALLATTVWPNLWLLGGVAGGFYGSRVAIEYANATVTAQLPLDASGPLSTAPGVPTSYPALTVLYLGRRLSHVYLYLTWVSQTLWFLYKTGQLSLEYYKQYAVLDDRFQIQSKLDAMNARFVQAKLDFDAWEKQNEIGRKILASLRTAWYIEEKSLAKRQRQAARERAYKRSRYRVVQLGWDVYFWCLQALERLWNVVTGRANTWQEWTEFWTGVSRDVREAMTSSDQWGSRLGAVVAAWMAVNAIGAMFAISPHLLNLWAVLFAIVWPSWTSEVYDRTAGWVDEIKAKGRDPLPEQDRSLMDPTWEWIQTVFGGGPIPVSTTTSLRSSSRPPLHFFLFRRYDKNRYHYYRRVDGTRRYYRTGNPLFGRPDNRGTATISTITPSSSPPPQSTASRANKNIQKKKKNSIERSWWPWNSNNNNNNLQNQIKKGKKMAQQKKNQSRRNEDSERAQWGLFG